MWFYAFLSKPVLRPSSADTEPVQRPAATGCLEPREKYVDLGEAASVLWGDILYQPIHACAADHVDDER